MTALVVAFWLVIGEENPTKVPACELYKITGPTVIAFFEYEGCENDSNCQDVLDDFQFYMPGLRKRFEGSAVRLHECYRPPFEVEIRGRRRKVNQKGVGYYVISPDKAPLIKTGVATDSDLVELMTNYFGPDVVNEAVVQPGSDLPVEWSSLLSEFVAHDAAAKAYVASKAADATDPRSRALAKAMLSEWDLSVHVERLKHPTSIHAPKPQVDGRQGHAGVFDISVDVGEDGRVLSAKFFRPSDQTKMGGEILRVVQTWLFRPAFKDGRFVRAALTVEAILHVK